MRIVMLEPLGIDENKVIGLAKPFVDNGHEFFICNKKIEDKNEIINKVQNADALIIANSPLPKEIIDNVKNLKMISVAFTGVDHVDIEECRKRKILVCNAQGYSTYAVSELTFGLIISVLRNLVPCHNATIAGRTKDGLIGNELFGKTIGIIGTGAIGINVASIAKAFGCRVLGYSRTKREEAIKAGIQYVDLEELLKQSDIVSIHTPLTNETRNLINKERINMMKDGAILINTARGPIVDSQALAYALNNGKLSGAGIDVFESEPPIASNHILFSAKNIVFAPHIGFATKESLYRRAEITFDNIRAWIDGKPQNVKI